MPITGDNNRSGGCSDPIKMNGTFHGRSDAPHLQELVLHFLRGNTVNGETILGVVDQRVSHESDRVVEVTANLAIDLNVTLQILVTSMVVKTYCRCERKSQACVGPWMNAG